MSYQITIGGHTRNEHNAQVKAIAEDAWAKVQALHDADETRASLSGWSGDQTGSISLATPAPAAADTSSDVQDAIATEPTPSDTT